MAMTKCKECGKEISTKAEMCPHCGAKPPRKTSMFTWLILIIFVLIYFFISLDTEKYGNKSTVASNAIQEKQKENYIVEINENIVNSLRSEFKEYLQSDSEPTVKDAFWENGVLSVGVFDNGSSRDEFAESVCLEMTSGRYDGIFGDKRDILIVIKDVRSMKRLGKTFCKKQ